MQTRGRESQLTILILILVIAVLFVLALVSERPEITVIKSNGGITCFQLHVNKAEKNDFRFLFGISARRAEKLSTEFNAGRIRNLADFMKCKILPLADKNRIREFLVFKTGAP